MELNEKIRRLKEIIDVAKNRNGETGEVKVNFVREFTRFFDRPIERKEDNNFQTSEPPPEHAEYVQDNPFL